MTRARDLANFADGTIGDVTGTLTGNVTGNLTGNVTGNINGLTPQASNMQPHNMVINGSMTVAQRATTHATSVTNGFHTVDRVKINGNSTVGQWTSSQDTDVPAGFSKSFKLECTTADTSLANADHFGFGYIQEGYSMDSVSKGTPEAKPMTLSFYMKASVLKTMVVEMTDASNSRHVNYSVIPSATNTWERIVINIPADTSGSFNQGTNSKAGELNFWLAAGSNYNSGTTQATWTARTAVNIMAGVSNWADTVGNTIWITGVQLEAGSSASSFAHENYSDTLQKCQRYFTWILNSNTSSNGGQNIGSSFNSIRFFLKVYHKVTMRASPAIINNSFGGYIAQNNTTYSTTSLATTWPYPDATGMDFHSSGMTSGYAGHFDITSGSISADAEL